MPLGAGTGTHLPVEEDVKEALQEAADKKTRAVKVVVDSKRPRLIVKEPLIKEHDTFEEDFAAITELLEDAVPCMVLVRLKDDKGTVPTAGDNDWALLAWTPEDAQVRQKMTYASSRKCLKEHFKDLSFKEFNTTERAEVTLAEFLEQTKPLSEEERRAAMSQAELDADDVRKQVAVEQAAAPKMLAGLAALQIKVLSSFSDALARLLAEEDKAVLGKLAGARSEELAGEVLDAAGSPEKLKGRLPNDDPCYVVLCQGDSKVLVMSWLPEGAGAKPRMKCSTFKASVLEVIRGSVGDRSVAQVEVTEEDDLKDDLGANAEAPGGGAAEAPVPAAGPRRPPGAVALPGMSGK